MRVIIALIVLVGMLSGQAAVAATAAPEAVVRAVLFWSKECPACHIVVQEVLPPIERQYGDRLDIRRLEMTDGSPTALILERARSSSLSLILMGSQALR